MRPDGPASDLDYDAQMGHSVEPEDWCETHQQRGSTCGHCHAVEPWGSTRQMTEAEMTEAFAAFFRHTLDRVSRADDEQMGTHFAARFDEGENR